MYCRSLEGILRTDLYWDTILIPIIYKIYKTHIDIQKRNETEELPIICTEDLLRHNTLISKIMIKTALQKSSLFKETLNYWAQNLEILSDVLMKNSLDLWFDIEELSYFLRASFTQFFSWQWTIGKKSNRKYLLSMLWEYNFLMLWVCILLLYLYIYIRTHLYH